MHTPIGRTLILLFLTIPALHAQDTWQQRLNGTPPTARIHHTAVWTGSEMIVWGGDNNIGSTFNTGGRYNPASNSWTSVTTAGAPVARSGHMAVWTGSEMIVWGGVNAAPGSQATDLKTGGRYNPATNSWTAMSTTGAPAARNAHTAVWTGGEMIVWVGFGGGAANFNDTFSYTPDCGIFQITSTVLDHGNLILEFPAVTGWTYTLWSLDTLTNGTWPIPA